MKIARKYKWIIFASILASVGICLGLVYADFQTDTKPVLKPSFIEPTTAAQKQKLTIPVQTEVKAHPAFYIYQDDSHNWRVDGSLALDRNMSSSNLTKGPNGPYYLPSKQKAFVKINSSNPAYLPDKEFKDNANNSYPISFVKNQKIVWSDWKKASDNGAEP